MTMETRTTVEPADIQAIEIECSKCHQKTVKRLDNWLRDTWGCPNCTAAWNQNEAIVNIIRSIAGGMSTLASEAMKDVPFSIRFEVRSPDGK